MKKLLYVTVNSKPEDQSASRTVGRALVNEILAEYKRCGAPKSAVIKALATFNPFFLANELIRRKKSAKKDIENCLRIANDRGLKRTGGTKEFPIFE